MTYIAAFPCQSGLVMCADTQETVGYNKEYVEKIIVADDYPIAVGGAGFGKLIEALTEEIIERVTQFKPEIKSSLRRVIREAVTHVYEKDAPTFVLPRQHRTPQLLIAAKPPKDSFCILPVDGRRLRNEVPRGIIGYATTYNHELLKRLHRDSLSMQQAVMLAVYLVSQSKKLDDGVGGETRVAVVVDNGAWVDDEEYIANSENRVREFLQITDELFFNSIDMSISPTEFVNKLAEFSTRLNSLRDTYLRWSAAQSLHQALSNPAHKGDPYPKLFAGVVTTLRGDGSVGVREDTPEDKARRKEMIEAAKQAFNKMAGAELRSLIKDRGTPEYIGEETARIYGIFGSK